VRTQVLRWQRALTESARWSVRWHATMARPRAERDADELRALQAAAPSAVDVDEARTLRDDLAKLAAWSREAAEAMEGRRRVEQVESLVHRAESSLVAAPREQVDALRASAQAARAWMDRVEATGLERGEADVDDLAALLREAAGLRVDVGKVTRVLEEACKVVCLCHRPAGEEADMFACAECRGAFHRACMPTRPDVCLPCLADCAVQRAVGLGKAALVRILAREDNGPDDNGRFAALKQWAAAVHACAATAETPPAPAAVEGVWEVRQIQSMLAMQRWGALVATLRLSRPQLADIDNLVASAPAAGVPQEVLDAFASIARRARALAETYAQTVALPESTPAEVVMERCRGMLEACAALPVEFGKVDKHCASILGDNANRHCLCRAFHDGSVLIQCEACERWFHPRCVGLEGQALDNVDFVCPECLQQQQQQQQQKRTV